MTRNLVAEQHLLSVKCMEYSQVDKANSKVIFLKLIKEQIFQLT
jgi:hypothetical protein